MLGRKTLLILITRFFISFFEGVLYIFSVKTFLPEQFGDLKAIVSLMGIFTFFASFGLEVPHMKLMAEKGEGNKVEQYDVFSTFLILKLTLIIISTIIVSSIFIFQLNKNTIFYTKNIIWLFSFVYLKNLFSSINQIYILSFRARLNVVKTEISLLLSSIVQFIISLIAIIIFQHFLIYVCSMMLTPILQLIYFLYKKQYVFTSFKVNIFKRYRELGKVFVLSSLMLALANNLGPFFFLMHYDSELLGIYAVITSFIGIIQVLENTFQSLLLPNFTQMLTKAKISKLRSNIYMFEKYLTIISTFIIVGLILFANLIIKSLMGEIYYEKGIYLYYGSMLYLLYIPTYKPYLNLITAAEKLKMITFVWALRFILSLLSWLFLIPYLNIIGIDFGVWVFILLSTIIVRVYCKREWNIGTPSKKSVLNLIIICFLVIGCLVISSFNLSFLYILLSFILIIGIYGLFLISSKIITKKDIEYIIDVLSTKKMMKHIITDI